ncbi:unannotated protein [freshwater metagenome]|uniref:Unannotated protein n=1 Tax=freshwater metagenome TaxID=449393 RepID=A0A6J6QJD5_9ZZZZ
MNFPEATQVINDISIPKVEIAAGMTILLPARKASTATADARTAITENILAPVADAITHSLIKTHSLFKTKPNVVLSFPGDINPKNINESVDNKDITETPARRRFSMFDLTFLIHSTPSK